MRRFAPLIGLLVALLTLHGKSVAQSPNGIWEFRDGMWQQVAAPVSEPQKDPELERIADLIAQKQFKSARQALKAWDKANKASPVRDQALMLFAELFEASDDPVRSYFHLDELLDTYPESRLYYPAVQMQYRLAETILAGQQTKIFGIPLGSAPERGVQMLYRIQQRAPGSPLAEQALLRTADFYYARGDFDFAADAYAAYVRNYPRSPLASKAQLRQAYSNLAQFRGYRFDPTPLLDAKTQLIELAASNPELAATESIPDLLERVDESLARKMTQTADLYRRTGHPQASAMVYRDLIAAYPNTGEAPKAAEALERLEAAGTRQGESGQTGAPTVGIDDAQGSPAMSGPGIPGGAGSEP